MHKLKALLMLYMIVPKTVLLTLKMYLLSMIVKQKVVIAIRISTNNLDLTKKWYRNDTTFFVPFNFRRKSKHSATHYI